MYGRGMYYNAEGGPAGGGAPSGSGVTDPGAGTGGTPGNVTAQPWFTGLPDNLRADPELVKMSTGGLDALASQFLASRKLIGKDPASLVEMPTDEAGQLALLRKLGAPEDRNGYDFKLPDALAQNEGLAKALTPEKLQWLGDLGAKFGIPAKAMRGLFEGYAGILSEGLKVQAQEADTAAQGHMQALGTKYGAALPGVLTEASYAAEKFGLTDVLNSSGLGSHPAVIDLLAFVAKNTGEGGEGSPLGNPNPTAMTPDQAAAKGRELLNEAIKVGVNTPRARELNAQAQRFFAIASGGK